MKEKEAKQIIESEFGDLRKEDRGQYDTLVSLLVKYGADDSRPLEKLVMRKPADKFNEFCKSLWKNLCTYTGNIGEWIHEDNFNEAMNEARKEGIRFTLTLMSKHGTAKTFDDRIKKELTT